MYKRLGLLGIAFMICGGILIGTYIHNTSINDSNIDKVPSVTVKVSRLTTMETKPSTPGKTQETLSKSTKETKETNHATEKQTKFSENESENNKLINSFKALCQYPELPTGCEITSLTMVLNYYGFDVDKCDLSDNYLDKGKVGTVDFRMIFEGDPRDKDSYGCYAPVIVNTANKFLRSQSSSLKAAEITDTEFEDLFEYTNKGVPVMVWCTYELAQGHFSVTWNVDGQDMTWYTPEHCMVLLGQKDDKAVTADPASGEIKEYDKELLKTRYEELFKQAVIIQ